MLNKYILGALLVLAMVVSCSTERPLKADPAITPFTVDSKPVDSQGDPFVLCVDVVDEANARVIIGTMKNSDKKFVPVRYLNGIGDVGTCIARIVEHSVNQPSYYTPILLSCESYTKNEVGLDQVFVIDIKRAMLVAERNKEISEKLNTFKAAFKCELIKHVSRVVWLDETIDCKWDMHEIIH